MKLNTKKIILLVMLYIISIFCHVYAADTYTYNLIVEEDKNQIKKGESITYQIKLSNINVGKGLLTFMVNVDYNSNIFNFEILDNNDTTWTKISNIENLLSFATSNYEPTVKDSVVAILKFTAKQDAVNGDYNIGFTKIQLGGEDLNGNFTLNHQDQIKSIKIAQDDNNNNNSNQNSSKNVIENQYAITNDNTNTKIQNTRINNISNNNISKNITNNYEQNNEKNENSFPTTGIKNQSLSILISIAIICMIISYYRYKNINNIK